MFCYKCGLFGFLVLLHSLWLLFMPTSWLKKVRNKQLHFFDKQLKIFDKVKTDSCKWVP